MTTNSGLDERRSFIPAARRAMVAIPANNEAERIDECLAALMTQTDRSGRPLSPRVFEVLVLANNCTDGTAARARRLARISTCPIHVQDVILDAGEAHAGGARRRAMEECVHHLRRDGLLSDVILTTDADSCVSATWIADNLSAFDRGVDCVAGFVEPRPVEFVNLGKAFMERGRLEDTYHAIVSEIDCLCDPLAHDPWPRHRMHSGASLGITLDAYLAIGGLPPVAAGEDAALVQEVLRAGFMVRHAMDVRVSTSCRLTGRAAGGAADAMRQRHANLNEFCDDDLESASRAMRRARMRAGIREAAAKGALPPALARKLGLARSDETALLPLLQASRFYDAWQFAQKSSPALRFGEPLRPTDLPREIARGERLLRFLRSEITSTGAQADRPRHARSVASAAA